MSDHAYSRSLVSGFWNLAPANLNPAVKLTLPGKAFAGRFNGTAVLLAFTDALTAPEIALLDTTVANTAAAFDPLPLAKTAKVHLVRQHTEELIALGALFGGVTYMNTAEGRFDVLGIFTLGSIAATPGFFPKTVSSINGTVQTGFLDAAAFQPFFTAMLETYTHWKESGQALGATIDAAATVAAVDAVVDNRTWPFIP